MNELLISIALTLAAYTALALRLLLKRELASRFTLVWCALLAVLYWWVHHSDGTIYFAVQSAVFAVFLIASAEDFKTRSVLDWQLIAAALLAIPLIYLDHPPVWVPLLGAAVALAVTGVPFLITREQGLGLGDVLFFTIIGALTGVTGLFITLTIAGMTGLFYAFFMRLIRRTVVNIPLVPFFTVGWVLTAPAQTIFNLLVLQSAG